MADMVQKISKVYADLKFEDLAPEVVENAKLFILDTLGCAYAGTNATGYDEVRGLFKGFGGKAESSLLAFNDKLPSPSATFVNAVASHALELDETFDDHAMHSYVVSVPTAMALAEARGISGKDFILSVLLGVDLTSRLGACLLTPVSFIRTASCGSFGAASAAAKVLGFDQQGFINAMGVVYSQTAGNMQPVLDRGLVKRMQPAFAARAGVLAALMAEEGVTGSKEIFEGPYGYFNLYERGAYDRNICLDGIGEEFYSMKLSIKPYPACRMNHASIDAALELQEEYGFTFEEVEKVDLYVSKLSKEFVGKPFEIGPYPQITAQFSIPYLVGVALTKGSPFIDDIDAENVINPKWQDVTSKIDVHMDESIGVRDINKASITIKLKNGDVLKHSVANLKGSPAKPFSWDDCIDKFKKCASFGARKFTDQELDQIVDDVRNLDSFTSEQLSQFFLRN